jgi:hypothetical protein
MTEELSGEIRTIPELAGIIRSPTMQILRLDCDLNQRLRPQVEQHDANAACHFGNAGLYMPWA